MKETYIKAASTIDKLKEPMEDLIIIRDTLREAAATDQAATDEPFRQFLYEDLAPGLAKRLYKERSNDEKVSFQVQMCSCPRERQFSCQI